jgi:hypothetical protein
MLNIFRFSSVAFAFLCSIADCYSSNVFHQYEKKNISNLGPERGFYTFRRTDPQGNIRFVDIARDRDFGWARKGGFTLISARVSLEKFRSVPIPDEYLKSIAQGLTSVRKSKLKVILRFNYNNGNTPGADASIGNILQHIQQLRPILKEHSDVIFALQAGFIGAWGEWNKSTSGLDTPTARAEVIQAELAEDLPYTSIQIRYPQHKIELLDSRAARDSVELRKSMNRIGFHIDCILASDNDLTYPLDKIPTLFRYVVEQSRSVLIGGETCKINPPRTDCDIALRVLSEQRFSYLNNDYHQGVVSSWRIGGCYAQIRERLGYRLYVESSQYADGVPPATDLQLALNISNDGWSAPAHSRLCVLVFAPESGGEVRILTDLNATEFLPGKTFHKLSVKLPATLGPGRYGLSLAAPDPSQRLSRISEYSLPFNNSTYSLATGQIFLGTIVIK